MSQDRRKPPSSPERPTVRPKARETRAGPAIAPELQAPPPPPPIDLEDLEVLEELIGEAEQDMQKVAPVLESQRPPDEPPRQLPAIGEFGDYSIVGRLALGGMAEILLAKEESAGAGSRYLVVKRILPEFENDDAFVQMFLDEARVMMRLKHPNVVHVYKFGKEDTTHYIAMEWVNGVSLGKLIRRARKTGGIPVSVACKIISSVAEALDHAHDATTEDGRPLGIVHRDVTPDNIMISYGGAVKLLDFGIAKAQSRAHKTQAGVVKGKFAYMAPEQCRAKELDRRVDVFAMGVCLFEAITGRPLYRRATEFETMEAIVRGPIPTLSERMKSPPAELEAIIAKCLAKKPEERFETAGEMVEALDSYVAGRGKVVNARRIKALLDNLFKDEQSRGPMVDTTPFGSSFHIASEPDGFKIESGQSSALPDDLPMPELEGLEGSLTPDYQGPAEGSVPLTIDADDNVRPGVPSTLSAGAGASLVQGDPTAPTPRNPISSVPATHAAPRTLAPPPEPESSGVLKWAALGILAIVAIGGAAYVAMDYLAPMNEGPDTDLDVAPVAHTGTLIMGSAPEGATLFVDDEEVGVTPATVPDLATGQHRVRLTLEGHVPHEGTVEIRADQITNVSQPLEATVQPEGDAPTGRLTLTAQPDSTVFLNGAELGTTPLTNVEVPSGLIALELVTPDGERHRRGVMIRADDDNSAHLDLRP